MSRFTNGLLFGAITGAIGGLLLAPKSGKDTRQTLFDELDEWSDLKEDFSEKLDTFKESAIVFQEATKIYTQPVITGIQKDIDNFKFQAEPRVAQIKEQFEKIRTELPQSSRDTE